jgi:predicted RNA-binding Zn-ribbon protein involved in translation (DUF1610 family)
MSEHSQTQIPCPRCGAGMIPGHLRDVDKTVYVESLRSHTSSALQALICPTCGHVELEAIQPENLAHRDMSDEELGLDSEDEWSESF